MIVRRLTRWFDDRLGATSWARTALNKVFPDHWSFMLGEIAMYCFAILVLTGIYLTFFFVPSSRPITYQGTYGPLHGATVSEAYASVVRLSFDVRAGLVFRQVHHWAANLFIASILVHLARIFLTGAFRRPREINWIIGMTLLVFAIFNGFTGYSLPDDLLSGTGLRIGYSVALSIPFLGTWLAFLVFGGEFPAHDIIPRLFVMHVMLVPAAIIGLLSIHLAIVWHQKHTQFPTEGRTETNVVGSKLWPTYAMKSLGLFFGIAAVLGLLGGLAQINPVWLYGPFNATTVSSADQPDWYLGWIEGALRLFPGWETRGFGHTVANPFFPGVVMPGLTFLTLYLWPFIEARFTGDREQHNLLQRPRDRSVQTGIGAGALSFYVVLFLAASNDIAARMFGVSVGAITWGFRIAAIVVPWVVGFVVYRLMRGLKVSEADRFIEVPMRAIVRNREAGR